MDFGRSGLIETLDVLSDAGLRVAGAGRHRRDAAQPAVVHTAGGTRMVIYAVGTESAGVPPGWRAGPDRAGIELADVRGNGAASLATRVGAAKQRGDIVIVSVHWGGNWGYDVPLDQVDFAHRLIDAGVDVVHGHSSHHPRPLEVYRGKLILYGCGDFINDYEGIGGYEQYRDDLRLLYLVVLDAAGGTLADLRIVPLQVRQLRLEPASAKDVAWLATTLDEVCANHRTGVGITSVRLPGGGSVPALSIV